MRIDKRDNPVDKLEVVRSARDVAEYYNKLDKHPELDELEQQFLKEIEEQGLTQKIHEKKVIENGDFTLKFKGQENPWNLLDVSTYTELKRKRNERDERLLKEEIEKANNSEKE